MSGDQLMACEYVPFLVPETGTPSLVRFLVRLLVTLAHVFAFNTVRCGIVDFTKYTETLGTYFDV